MTHAIVKHAIVVTGTDTGIGKTIFAAGLVGALDGIYWKPVQAGIEGGTDSQAVARLSGLPEGRILRETWLLRTPASPHHAAELEGVEINAEKLNPPVVPRYLVIEGAGGVMVPLNRRRTFLDVLARWRLPTVLCARTRLGTINHTLLSLAAMRDRGVPVLGVALIGDAAPETQRIIAEMGRVRVLGRLPRLERLNSITLTAAFHEGFSRDDFRVYHGRDSRSASIAAAGRILVGGQHGGQFDRVPDPHLGQNPAAMHLDRAHRDLQRRRDLLVHRPAEHQPHDLVLARRQGGATSGEVAAAGGLGLGGEMGLDCRQRQIDDLIVVEGLF